MFQDVSRRLRRLRYLNSSGTWVISASVRVAERAKRLKRVQNGPKRTDKGLERGLEMGESA